MKSFAIRVLGPLVLLLVVRGPLVGAEVRVGVFDVDATPPVGSPLAYDPTKGAQGTLRFKGLVFAGSEKPIVVAVVDWLGIGGEGHDHVRDVIARAVGTTVERVSVHAVHQHDAPRFDLGADRYLADVGLGGRMFDGAWSRSTIQKVGAAAKRALDDARPLTHVSTGMAKVEKVASNRRILDADGKVKHVRYTAARDPAIRAFPEGPIDPMLRSITFHSGDDEIAVATFYATHPQSYYRTGLANADFPGLAREARAKATGVPHIHFNGAGGNVGAGKYNDGSPENRAILAGRVETGMRLAYEASRENRVAVGTADIGWRSKRVLLPVGRHVTEERYRPILENAEETLLQRVLAAKSLAFLERSPDGAGVDIGCLAIGPVRMLCMPGELFVEYQLAAQVIRPDRFVTMAAYGEYAPGYIGTRIGYGQGGYETSERASRVAPDVEDVLVEAMQELLESDVDPRPLGDPPAKFE